MAGSDLSHSELLGDALRDRGQRSESPGFRLSRIFPAEFRSRIEAGLSPDAVAGKQRAVETSPGEAARFALLKYLGERHAPVRKSFHLVRQHGHGQRGAHRAKEKCDGAIA